MNPKNKTIIVTGGGNGMGRAMVLNLLKRGARVAAVDMRESALEETKLLSAENAGNLSVHVLDITDKAAVEKFPEIVMEAHGAVDGLINNAGIIQPFVRVNDLEFSAIERVMNVNFYGLLYMVKAFLPHFLKRPEAHIVNISSMGGFLPVPGQSVYGASKAAVKLLSEGLYGELMNSNVKVSVVFPGAIGTNITTNSGVNIPNMPEAGSSKIKTLSPEKAAEIIISGMEKNKVRIYAGNDSLLMNYLYRLSPGFATRFIGKQMKSLLK
ncbi:MAG: SDR family oxidoreductase [Bacteroidetes bacterium]|nr:SDR family oxidoreductase [Bacteroidota bacterium]